MLQVGSTVVTAHQVRISYDDSPLATLVCFFKMKQLIQKNERKIVRGFTFSSSFFFMCNRRDSHSTIPGYFGEVNQTCTKIATHHDNYNLSDYCSGHLFVRKYFVLPNTEDV